MKTFLSENWYKLMIGSSLLMASFGFMVYSIIPAKATDSNNKISSSNYRVVPLNEDGTISVRLSDDQLNKIIQKNHDGSINIKIIESQLKTLQTNTIQSVNIAQILGYPVAAYEGYNNNKNITHYSLGVDRFSW